MAAFDTVEARILLTAENKTKAVFAEVQGSLGGLSKEASKGGGQWLGSQKKQADQVVKTITDAEKKIVQVVQTGGAQTVRAAQQTAKATTAVHAQAAKTTTNIYAQQFKDNASNHAKAQALMSGNLMKTVAVHRKAVADMSLAEYKAMTLRATEERRHINDAVKLVERRMILSERGHLRVKQMQAEEKADALAGARAQIIRNNETKRNMVALGRSWQEARKQIREQGILSILPGAAQAKQSLGPLRKEIKTAVGEGALAGFEMAIGNLGGAAGPLGVAFARTGVRMVQSMRTMSATMKGVDATMAASALKMGAGFTAIATGVAAAAIAISEAFQNMKVGAERNKAMLVAYGTQFGVTTKTMAQNAKDLTRTTGNMYSLPEAEQFGKQAVALGAKSKKDIADISKQIADVGTLFAENNAEMTLDMTANINTAQGAIRFLESTGPKLAKWEQIRLEDMERQGDYFGIAEYALQKRLSGQQQQLKNIKDQYGEMGKLVNITETLWTVSKRTFLTWIDGLPQVRTWLGYVIDDFDKFIQWMSGEKGVKAEDSFLGRMLTEVRTRFAEDVKNWEKLKTLVENIKWFGEQNANEMAHKYLIDPAWNWATGLASQFTTFAASVFTDIGAGILGLGDKLDERIKRNQREWQNQQRDEAITPLNWGFVTPPPKLKPDDLSDPTLGTILDNLLGPGTGRQGGGHVGGPVTVGERGPETFIPYGSGIVAANVGARGSASASDAQNKMSMRLVATLGYVNEEFVALLKNLEDLNKYYDTAADMVEESGGMMMGPGGNIMGGMPGGGGISVPGFAPGGGSVTPVGMKASGTSAGGWGGGYSKTGGDVVAAGMGGPSTYSGKESFSLAAAQGTRTQEALGVGGGEWEAFRHGIASIESQGKYGIMGGSSNRFAGAYQMGGDEIRETAASLGVAAPSRQQFLQDPAMQERFFDAYTADHHKYLMKNNAKYRNMGPQERMQALAYAHNQGAGGASQWLNTGREGRDAFGTAGGKYAQAVGARLANVAKDHEEHPEGHGDVVATSSGSADLPGTVKQFQQKAAAIRKQPLASSTEGFLQYASAQTGLEAHVWSGGQDEYGPNRTGSHRHDKGGAGDIKLWDPVEKRYLNMNNKGDAQRMAKFTEESVRAGATGVGAGQGYMGAESIHIGGGKSATWGGASWIPGAHARGSANRIDLAQWQAAERAKKQAKAVPPSPVTTSNQTATASPPKPDSVITQSNDPIANKSPLPVTPSTQSPIIPGPPPANAKTAAAVDDAAKLIGMNENGPDRKALKAYMHGWDPKGDNQAWCATFVNSAMKRQGVKGAGGYATSWGAWGTEAPYGAIQKGDVLVKHRGKQIGEKGGHLAMATGEQKMMGGELWYQGVSGNVADSVSRDWYKASEVWSRRAEQTKEEIAQAKEQAKQSQAQQAQAVIDGVKGEAGQAKQAVEQAKTMAAQDEQNRRATATVAAEPAAKRDPFSVQSTYGSGKRDPLTAAQQSPTQPIQLGTGQIDISLKDPGGAVAKPPRIDMQSQYLQAQARVDTTGKMNNRVDLDPVA